MPVLSQLLGVGRSGRLLDRAAGTVHRADPAPVRARPTRQEGKQARPATLRLQPGFRPRPDRPSPQSQSFSRSYGSGLPTSLTYIVLFGQRLFTLETCCGYRYDNQARVRQDVLHSPGFSRADRSSPDAAAGATFSGATGPYLRKNHSPGRHMLLK